MATETVTLGISISGMNVKPLATARPALPSSSATAAPSTTALCRNDQSAARR